MPATLHRGVHRMRRVTEEDMSLKSMTLEETMEIVGMAATGAPHHRQQQPRKVLVTTQPGDQTLLNGHTNRILRRKSRELEDGNGEPVISITTLSPQREANAVQSIRHTKRTMHNSVIPANAAHHRGPCSLPRILPGGTDERRAS